ncbi:hypothetical protein KCP76_16290 [Salmonella enterica subsp. enterica serovar Weltevreden]|nr:hypothetical protein KCP76_16290 [Salmonella enterica subsp. enterica serovar Weltevreden]
MACSVRNRQAKANTPLPISPKGRGTEITLHLREGEMNSSMTGAYARLSVNIPISHLPVEVKNGKKRRRRFHGKINKAQALWTRNKSEIKDERVQRSLQSTSRMISPIR